MDLLERDDELQRLRGALARAAGGAGRIVAITGEAGAGKTSLVERFTAGAKAPLYWGACEHLSTPEPLLPLHDVARTAGPRFSFDPSADHARSFDALLRLLGAAPSILVLEDVHWADMATLDLVRFLGRRVARVPALILLTHRTESESARSPLRDVLGEIPAANVERMSLAPLSREAVTRLAAARGRPGAELHALTGGNPFFVTELLAVEGDALPDAVRDATLARAARLPAAARAVLDVVSIFPRRAEIELATALVGGEATAGIDACIESGMLLVDGDTLRFRHEIARLAIEASLPPAQRRRQHQRLVDLLRVRNQPRASEIAHHAERAGDIDMLLSFAERAAEDAARVGAFREAAAHSANLLRHRDAVAPARGLQLLERHAELCYLAGAADDAVTAMQEAVELRRAQRDPVALGRALTRLTRFAWVNGQRSDAERYVDEAIAVLHTTAPGPERAWAYSHRSQLHMLAARSREAIDWGSRALQLAQSLGEAEIVVHAMTNIGTSRTDLDGLDARGELERSAEVALDGGFHDHYLRAVCNLTCAAYWWRDDDMAQAQIERGVAYAGARDLLHWEAYLRGWRAMLLLDQGAWNEGEREAEEIARWIALPHLFRFPGRVMQARLHLRRGDDDAAARFETILPVWNIGELQRSLYIALVDAERAWLAGEKSELLRVVHEAAHERQLQCAIEDSSLWLAILGEKVAKIDALPSPYREHCSGDWRGAAAGWRARNRPYEEALALCQGDEEAQRGALEIFDRLGAGPAAARLRRTMREAGVRSIPRGPIAGTRANFAGLTPRQAQVLGLLAEDLTNVEIADRLCISAKTAEHHVAAIMARLDVPTRREAAAAARARGLLDTK